ncbi:MAG: ATP-grasp domain-containing protein [Alphaproteobacteria bacterium]|nr:ATP-grasp domain-containing protein [Alphaproteobacteria bacterium]
MNFLILSCGTRNKIVQYFKKVFNDGVIVATDMSELAPALYEADKHYVVPRITADGYLDVIVDICKREHINGVLSLIDPELNLLAKNKKRFDEIGVKIVGSDFDQCERSFDKFKMYNWMLEHGYKCAKSYMDREKFYSDVEKGLISYPVFVKPSCGSASIAISKAFDKETVDLLCSHSEGMMIQEFLQGQEIGADVYIDMISKKVVSIFTKKKIVMRAGETDKAVSFKDPELFDLIERFAEEGGFTGQIDIDIFEINGEYYISEVNPRFGGGYPHAFECGCDHMTLIKYNLAGEVNPQKIGDYEANIYMMKYNEVAIKKKDVFRCSKG